MKLLKIILPFIVLMLMHSWSPKNPVYWVSGFKAECNAGAGTKQCLLISKNADLKNAKWELFYSGIAGFEFEEGRLQKIEVKITDRNVAEVPADASSLSYEVFNTLMNREDPRTKLNTSWKVARIKNDIVKPGNLNIRLHIDLTRMRITGTDDCNKYSGLVKFDGINGIAFSKIFSTLRRCPNMDLPNHYIEALKSTVSFKINNGELTFLNENQESVLVFKTAPSPAANQRLHDIWAAESIMGVAIDRTKIPTLEINLTTKRVMGTNGCNDFWGNISQLDDSKIGFGNMAITENLCADMRIPRRFDKAIKSVVSYKLDGLILTLFNKEDKKVLTFLKVD